MIYYTELVYGGRVLKVGKTLGEYRIVSGCTVFAMVTKTTKRECITHVLTSIR